MRYLRRLLEQIRTAHLVTFVAVTDLALFFGIVPFELYCRSAVLTHRSDVPFLLVLLGANGFLILLMFAAMAACSIVVARLGRQAIRIAVPTLRRRIR